MAHILNDRIVCSTQDPIIKVSVPANLKCWIEEAAAWRCTTVQDMLCDLLFDRYHKVRNEQGQYRKPNNIELMTRQRARWRKLDALQRLKKKNAKVTIPLTKAAIGANKQAAWDEYTKIRAANIKILEQQEFDLNRRVLTRRSSAELEELSARLDVKGIKAVKILIDGKQVLLRPDNYKSGSGRNVGIYDKKTGLVAGSTQDFSEARAVYEEVRAKYEALEE